MIINEFHGNLFNSNLTKDSVLAHCIAADFNFCFFINTIRGTIYEKTFNRKSKR